MFDKTIQEDVFALNGLTAGELPETGQAPARAFVLNFGDESTGFASLSTDSKDFKCGTWALFN